MTSDTEVFAAVEIVSTENKEVLWIAPYLLSRSHGKGEAFIEDYKEYLVIDSCVTRGKLGGVLVEHVVKLIKDRTPSDKSL